MIRPLRVAATAVDSEIGELQDLLGSASLVSGNFGSSHGFLARMFGLRQMRHHIYSDTSSHGRSLRLFTIRPPVVAVSEKISAIWGAERRGPGAK